MVPAHIDDFYYATSEVLIRLYSAFPVRHLLLVEDITGPIQWDMTGLPDRRSRATFETLVWLSEYGLLDFRTVEPRDIGLEGAVLTQPAFVLLNGMMRWQDEPAISRITGLNEARNSRAYSDVATIITDLLRANCQWSVPVSVPQLHRSATFAVTEELFDQT